MATITIKGIPDDLYEDLKRQAAANRRSVNSEVIMLIERACRSYRPDVAEMQAKAHALREMTVHYQLTEETLDEWKGRGRP